MSEARLRRPGGTYLPCLLAGAVLLGGCGSWMSEPQSVPPTKGGLEGTDKGDSRAEPAGDSHLSRADCVELGASERRPTRHRLRVSSEPTPPLSQCRLTGSGSVISVYLDAAHAAHQRYENRVVETAQFGTSDPSRLPHPLAGVGDPSASGHGANWVPALNTLFAVRGNRWLTVAYSVPGKSKQESRSAAADLARLAFRLSAD